MELTHEHQVKGTRIILGSEAAERRALLNQLIDTASWHGLLA